MLKQKFTVVPQGIIKSGAADYSIDEKTGAGVANYDIIAGVWVFTKELKSSGAFKADPEQFKSSNVVKGKVIQVSSLILTVLDVVSGEASVGIALQSADGELSGIAKLDVSNQFLTIKSGKISGTIMGKDVTLEITPAV